MSSLSEQGVPKRKFGNLRGVPRGTLRTMLDELQQEIKPVASAFKSEAADRNGLTDLLSEMERRNML